MGKGLVVVVSILLGVALNLAGAAASRVFLNDSGHVARAIRITFSEPVKINGFGDRFDYQSPRGEATTFVFTGMPLDDSQTFWVSWSPDSATVVESEWLRTGGEVQVDINIKNDPATLDPSTVDGFRDPAAAWVIEQLFLGLVDYDENGNIVPELASSWEASPDATVWTFILRDAVTWSDGVPVTAQDLRCGFLRALDPEHPYPYSYVFDVIHGAKAYYTGETHNPESVGVEVIDRHTIRFILDQPTAHFPALAVIWPFFAVPKHLIDREGDAWADPENIVTDGPYRLVKWAHDDHITLEKNEDYYAARDVHIERVVMWELDPDEAWDRYVSGLLDTADISTEQLQQTIGNPTMVEQIRIIARHQRLFGTGTYLYGFNVNLPPFDNPLVRKAFMAAVDREGVMETAARAGETIFPELALTLVPPGICSHVNGQEERIGIPYDPQQAREWLAEAGFPGGEGLPPITLWFNGGALHQNIAEHIQQNWTDNLDVTVELHSMRWHDYLEQVSSGNCQVWRLGWVPDYPDLYSSLHDFIDYPGVRNGLGGWRNIRYEDLLSQLSSDRDSVARRDLCMQAEKILVETDAVIMPLFYYGSAIATKPYLHRTFPSFGAPDIANWQLGAQDEHLP